MRIFERNFIRGVQLRNKQMEGDQNNPMGKVSREVHIEIPFLDARL